MNTYTLLRSYLPDRTIGKMRKTSLNGYLSTVFSTLERPWLDNATDVSCIPEGTYLVIRDKVGRFKYYAVSNVAGRTFIEFHGGVVPAHSNGCILLGMSFTSKYNLADSEKALSSLLAIQEDNSFLLVIRSFTPHTDKW